jgi:cytochrome P450
MTMHLSTTPGQMPRMRGHWLVGLGPDFLRRPLEMFSELATRGDIVRFRLPAMPSVLVNHPELVKRVLHDSKTYDKNMRSYHRLRPLVGNGLATSDGDFWMRQRRIAQPAFHRQRIHDFGAIMVRLGEAAGDGWRRLALRGEPVEIAEDMTRLTLAVVCEALFGGDVAEDTEILARTFSEVVAYLVDRMNLLWYSPMWVPTPANRRCREALAALDGAVYRIIARRRAQREASPDLLWMMMQARDADTGETMSDLQLRDEMVTMLLGGHDTTAATLTWAICLLAQHPDAEAQLQAELSGVLAGRSPTAADVEQLPYLRMVIDETMRLYPPIYVVARNAARDAELGGYPIARGTAVFVSPWTLHRSPALWDAPAAFRPERFAPEQADARHRYAFCPFVGGPRQCIGNAFALMEARLVLAVLAQRYRFKLAPGCTAEPHPVLTLRPKDGLRVLLEPVSHATALEPQSPTLDAAVHRQDRS